MDRQIHMVLSKAFKNGDLPGEINDLADLVEKSTNYLIKNHRGNIQKNENLLRFKVRKSLSKLESDGHIFVSKDSSRVIHRPNFVPIDLSDENAMIVEKCTVDPNTELLETYKKISEKQKKISNESESKPSNITKSTNPSNESNFHKLLVDSLYNFSHFGGYAEVLERLEELFKLLKFPMLYQCLGLKRSRGILIHGPSGAGKTFLAWAIAGQFSIPVINVSLADKVNDATGNKLEQLIKAYFAKARTIPNCMLLIDHLEVICSSPHNDQKPSDRHLTSLLCSCFDELHREDSSGNVIVVGITNDAEQIERSLRRAGRFDHEIQLSPPSEKCRQEILNKMCTSIRTHDDVDFGMIAKLTPGFLAADLLSLVDEAGTSRLTRFLAANHSMFREPLSSNHVETQQNLFEQLKQSGDDFIHQSDFLKALTKVQPSVSKSSYVHVPDITWEDVGGLENVIDELRLQISGPIFNPELFEQLNISTSSGILLAGPPGCGKTLIAKALANEAGINFISVKGPELVNMYLGESERAVRDLFGQARSSAPCVIFFDEVDSLCPKRSFSSANESKGFSRIVNQLLVEMDGLYQRKSIFVLAATNRPDILDPAILRPGRFDKILFVELPSLSDRVKILKAIFRKLPQNILQDVTIEELARDERCENFSGADLYALVREASLNSIKARIVLPIGPIPAYKKYWESTAAADSMEDGQANNCGGPALCRSHFDEAFKHLKPSVVQEYLKYYEKVKNQFRMK